MIAYFVLFPVVVAALFRWQIHRRRERPPEAFKLLRSPGESLRRRVQQVDEQFLEHLFLTCMAPLFAGCLVLVIAIWLPKEGITFSLIAAVTIFGASLITAGSWFLRKMRRRRDDLLGYLGERSVADQLEPLTRKGYRVFHDVPAQGRDRPSTWTMSSSARAASLSWRPRRGESALRGMATKITK